MNLKTYLAEMSRGGPSAFAASIGVSLSYLSQLASGAASVSPARCVEIEQITNGAVSRRELRPDDWRLIWPELSEKVSP